MRTQTAMWGKNILHAVMLVLLLSYSRALFPYPMHDLSVNQYSKILLQNNRIPFTYIVDLAEIPIYQQIKDWNVSANAADPLVLRFIKQGGTELGHNFFLTLNGTKLLLLSKSNGAIYPASAGGLPTMKMGSTYETACPAGIDHRQVDLHYIDHNYAGRTGWKESVATSSTGLSVKSSVPSKDRSAELNDYPTDLLNSHPQTVEALLILFLPALVPESVVKPVPVIKSATMHSSSLTLVELSERPQTTGKPSNLPAASLIPQAKQSNRKAQLEATPPPPSIKANGQETRRSKFIELITAQHLSPWFLFTVALIVLGLGGLHAIEAGHGKTIMAVYLVGSRGTATHAFFLGLIVTVSHTAGVFALGAITLYASHYIVPEHLYPWLGIFSGLTISSLGLYMFLRRLTGTAADHSHTLESLHTHWLPFFRKESKESCSPQLQVEQTAAKSLTLTQLLTRGIIPCPAVFIVLLSAFGLHRIGLGFFLIVAFTVGLAAVLIGFGMLTVYASRFMTHLCIDGPWMTRYLSLASSVFIMTLGIVLTAQAAATIHLNTAMLTKEKLGPVLFVIGLGLILGMRHSTDADHVVAISTIVSRQKSIRNAAIIGSVWGLGHTITIFIVGSLIILFGVEIPPRVGLSMEFSVAVMLVLLGILNLTGVLQKVSKYFTPNIVSKVKLSLDDAAPKLVSKWAFESPVKSLGLYQCTRPLVIGLVHGLAGSAAVALLVLSTIHTPVWAAAYLLIFGAGTMVGMMIMTSAIAVPLTFAGDRFSKLSHYLGMASGMVSLCFGTFLIYQLGFVDGLFTSHPLWTPQ